MHRANDDTFDSAGAARRSLTECLVLVFDVLFTLRLDVSDVESIEDCAFVVTYAVFVGLVSENVNCGGLASSVGRDSVMFGRDCANDDIWKLKCDVGGGAVDVTGIVGFIGSPSDERLE